MSFIAFDLDALNAAPAVARAAGVTENDVLGGLLRLWAWCFRSETDVVTALQLRGHFGVDAGPALEAFGFLAKIDEGWRVRGAERYLKVKASQRSAAARTNARRATGAPNGGASVDRRSTDDQATDDRPVHSRPSPNTEHRTPDEKNVRTADAAKIEIDQLIEAQPVVAGPVVYQPPSSDPSTWLAEDFWAWSQSQRQASGLLGERTRPRGLGAWWSTARMTTTAEALQRAWRRFREEEHWENSTPPYPFAAFIKQWDRYVPASAPTAPARPDAAAWEFARSKLFEAGADSYVVTQFSHLAWAQNGTTCVGRTEDPYLRRSLAETFDALLAAAGLHVSGPKLKIIATEEGATC